MRLHELSADYLSLQEEDIGEEAIADTLEAIEGEIELKAENIGLLVENWESDIAVLTEYKKKLEAKIATKKNRIESLKDYLRENMEVTGIKKIQCPLFAINCVSGRDMVSIDDQDQLPDEFVSVQVVTKPDKKKILEALKQGDDVSGASLTRTKSSIRIK